MYLKHTVCTAVGATLHSPREIPESTGGIEPCTDGAVFLRVHAPHGFPLACLSCQHDYSAVRSLVSKIGAP